MGISNFTTFVNKINKIYKLGFWIKLIPKAAPSCHRGPILLLFDSQAPKLFLALFCNTLQNFSLLAQSRSKLKTFFTALLISRLLKVQNRFRAHLGLGLSLTEAQQPWRNPRIRVWASDRQPLLREAAHGDGSGSLGCWRRRRACCRTGSMRTGLAM